MDIRAQYLIVGILFITGRTVAGYRGRLLHQLEASLIGTGIEGNCTANDTMVPAGLIAPVAIQKPLVLPLWGHTRQDNWHWLRDNSRQDPEVLQYLREENAFTEDVLGGGLTDTLESELRARISPDDHSVPQRMGLFWYYSYRRKGDQYLVHCRRRLPEGSGPPTENDVMNTETAEKVLLDENVEAAGHTYFDLGGFQVSADHRFLAYAVDFSGDESYEIYVKDIAEDSVGRVDTMHAASGELAWGLDNRNLFFTTVTRNTRRSDKLWRWHVNHTAQAGQKLIYTEPDEAFHLKLTHTRRRKHLLVYGISETTKYLLYLPALEPKANLTVLGPKVHGRKYHKAADWGDSWMLLVSDMQQDTLNGELIVLPMSNSTHLSQLDPNATLMRADAAPIAANGSTVLIKHSHDVELEDFEVSQRYLTILKRMNGLSTAYTYPLPSSGALTALPQGRTLAFEEESYSLDFGKQGPYDSVMLRILYSSFVTPHSTFDINMVTGKRVLKKERQVLGGFDREQYRSFRLWAASADGVQVPVSVVHRKGAVRLDGSDPLLLYAYGAYGAAQDAEFDANRLSLLDRGFIYSIAHVRGGGDLGQYWYLDGKLLSKNHTFSDLIAAAQLLIAEGYTSPKKLCIWGRSAGGLTIGASVNMRPDLFQAAIMDVPFVDVVSTMSDPTLPLTVTEYEEWGDPVANESMYNYMLSYSPVDNVGRHAYPNMLVTGGLNDPRVSYWEPAKWVSKTRALATNKPLILLKENMGAGHFGTTGVYSSLHDTALKYAFLLRITCTVMDAQKPPEEAHSGVCIPCVAIFIVVVAGFGGLVSGSLYYGGSMLQSWRKFGEGRGLGLREVAMQGFRRGQDKDEDEEDEDVTLDRRREQQESERLIPADQH